MEPKDDHFNKHGRFMYRDNKKTNNIIVHTDDGNAKLSQLNYTSSGTRKAVSNIIAYYARKKGLSGVYGVKIMGSESTGAHTTRNKSVFFNAKQFEASFYNDFHTLGNTLDHEAGPTGHKSENITPYNYLAHTKVYLGQSKTSDYGLSSEHNQYSVAEGFMQRLWNAYLNKEVSWQGMDPYIDDFNKNNTGGVTVTPIGGYDGPMDISIKNDNRETNLRRLKKMSNPND
ncbi:hypothetical protein MKJ01_15910 [Chryseobacterium sp. SSA4.19]|uniref:hypothetical protein n=1 Tax=Chryseobacterium sp. SSA4.19 TaxID=2919915 RepID=UPI001F4EC259|nr:hypothetical protein [Chryseobacterium sp. SSA4.19]MCJ8155252.1 hypothetical protein [Chryseobacterium sp. SSA4.19]